MSGCLLKRYLLFQGDTYYPAPGFGDFVDSFDTKEEAEAHPAYKFGTDDRNESYQWAEIIDTHSIEDVLPAQKMPDGKWLYHSEWDEYDDSESNTDNS